MLSIKEILEISKQKKVEAEAIIPAIIENRIIAPNIFDGLYDCQRKAIEAVFKYDKGIVCMPTGVGKTYCEAAIIANDIITNPNQFRIYVINAPRILLTFQLHKEIFGFLAKKGIDARYMFVHSGGTNEKESLEILRKIKEKATELPNAEEFKIPYAEILSGTSPYKIQEMMEKSKNKNMPIVFFSTYNSAERIEIARKMFTEEKISIVLNDEAHYLVQERFHDNILENFNPDELLDEEKRSKSENALKSKRWYFFTATMIYTSSDKGMGMNNDEDYGKVIFKMTPREAIEAGKMIRPRLHFVETKESYYDYNTDDYNKNLSKIITDTFKKHEEQLIEHHNLVLSRTPDSTIKIQLPKILVSVKGVQNILDFISSREYCQLRNEGVDIYAVASTINIGNVINPVIGKDIMGDNNILEGDVNRQEFLKKLKIDGENPTKRLIVLHYDILAEGIDVSGFTGIMPLRTLHKSKFLQTYGRCARLENDDKKKMDKGEIHPDDLDKMNKPYAYIMIPHLTRINEDEKEYIEELIAELRKDYGFKLYEDIVSDSEIRGENKEKEIDPINPKINKSKSIGKLLENLAARIENERLANLSKLDYLKEGRNAKKEI